MPIIQPNNPSNQPAEPQSSPIGRREKGTGFTQIQRILGANQGAGDQMGNIIGSGLTSQAGNLSGQLGQAQNQFRTQFDLGKNKAQSDIDLGKNLVQQTGESNDAYAARVAAANANNTNLDTQGTTFANAAYSGPSSIAGADRFGSQARNIGQQGSLAGSGAGQSMLLGGMVAKPGTYTRGQNALDQLLLGQSVQGQQALRQAQAQTSGLARNVGTALSSAENLAKGTSTGIQQQKTQAQMDLTKALGSEDTLDQGILGRGASAKDAYNAEKDRLQQLLTKRDANQASFPVDNLTDADKALLQRMTDFGINNDYTVDTRNNDLMQGFLNKISGGLQTQSGMKLSDNEKQAALNLSDFLKQQDIKTAINQNKFGTNKFQGDINDLAGDIKSADTQERAQKQGAANEWASFMSKVSNDPALQRYINDPGLWQTGGLFTGSGFFREGGSAGARLTKDDAIFKEAQGLLRKYGEGEIYTNPDFGRIIAGLTNKYALQNSLLNHDIQNKTKTLQDYINQNYGISSTPLQMGYGTGSLGGIGPQIRPGNP